MLEHVQRAPTGSGPLDGLKVAVKELVAIGGHALSANTPVPLPTHWADPVTDADIVAVLRAAGATVVGTTTTHEFAWGITSYDRGRRVENPRLTGRIAGGSSGGSAEAVALGQCDLAIGTDTAGSVRIPAAWCHVVGWKFTEGLVPMGGILPLAPGLDHPGLLAAEATTLLRAADALGTGNPSDDHDLLVLGPLVDSDPRAATIVHRAADLLAIEGHRVTECVGFPSADELMACFAVVQGEAALRAHRDAIGTWPDHRDLYAPYITERMTIAEQRSAEELAEARHRHADLRHHLTEMTQHGIVVLPATGCGPPTTAAPDYAPATDRDLRSVVLPHTVPANLAGLPAVTVPFSAEGEEFGVQLLGPPGSDRTLLRMAGKIMSTLERADR